MIRCGRERQQLIDEQTAALPKQLLAMLIAMSIDSKLSIALQKWFAGVDFVTTWQRRVDFVGKLESAKDVDVEKDDDVRLFSDFIDDYIKMENRKYTKKELQEDMMAMFNAAVDTLHSTLSFALLTLGRKPKLQQELSEEMVNVFGDDFESIKLKENITKIPKLRAFIHEILRLYPPTPIVGMRKILDDGVTVGPYTLPLGSIPVINIVAIHHNPKYWIKDCDEKKHGD